MARETWSNRLLYISTMAGATIGFGATWRFPYQVGQNGGGAYLLVFLIAMFVLGIPMLIAEHIIGRRLQTNVVDAFGRGTIKRPISQLWKGIGLLAIIGAFGIIAYYMVLGAWVTSYIVDMTRGAIDLSHSLASEHISAYFQQAISDPLKMVAYTFLFVLINYIILVKGIIHGIEKLISKIMPLFLLILVVMVVYAVQLPGAKEGLAFYLIPDFSRLNAKVFLEALGQVFFALSLGFGVMVTLASYLNKKEDIVNISITAGIINTIIPFMIGFIIFPALFSAGIEPAAGPTLVFVVLPVVFSNMPFGTLFAILFFILLILAALTTSVTIYEVAITTLTEKTRLRRAAATFITLAVSFVLGNVPSVLSDSTWQNVRIFGMSIFNMFDFVSANVFFILTSFLTAIFIGFVLRGQEARLEITNDGAIHSGVSSLIFNYIKYCVPIIILIVAIMNFV